MSELDDELEGVGLGQALREIVLPVVPQSRSIFVQRPQQLERHLRRLGGKLLGRGIPSSQELGPQSLGEPMMQERPRDLALFRVQCPTRTDALDVFGNTRQHRRRLFARRHPAGGNLIPTLENAIP